MVRITCCALVMARGRKGGRLSPGAGPQGILLSLIHATSGLTKHRRGETPALKSGALTCGARSVQD